MTRAQFETSGCRERLIVGRARVILALTPHDRDATHNARSGDKGAKILAAYIVEKGKPLATPAS